MTGRAATFVAQLQGPLRAQAVEFRPLHTVVDEYYNGYTRTTRAPAMRQVDVVSIADAASEAAHGFKAVNSNTGVYSTLAWRDAETDGYMEYKMEVSAIKQTYLRVMYMGDDASNGAWWRIFDLQALKADGTYTAFATQSLDREAPGDWYTVVYPIPMALTRGMSGLTIRLQAKGYNSKPGTAGGVFDQIQTFTLSDADDGEDELWTMVKA